MEKIAIFAFQGELMCFAHALLNALELNKKGFDVKLIIEGSATALIEKLKESDTPFSSQYREIKEKGILAGICKACATKMGTIKEAEKQGLTILGEMSGHPAFSTWLEQGYKIISM